MANTGSDDDLISRAREGDESAWRELYTAHGGRLVLWIGSLRLADSSTDADDIAAEAWFTAARRLHEFEGDSDAFAGWLFGIARNLGLNSNRKASRRNTFPHPFESEDTLILGTSEDPSAIVAGDENVRRLLSRLPQREAEVIACIDVVGLDVAATATALGISANSVRVARHRGLGKLRKLMS